MKAVKLNLLIAVGLVLLLCTPAQSQFVRTLGGTWYDYGYLVIQTSDGGFVVTGSTESFGAGTYDLFLSKFDISGNHLWSKTLGGESNEGGWSVVQTSDGGLVVTGYTDSFGAGGRDLLLSKFDASGNHLWSKTLGGTTLDEGRSVVQTSDGGLVVTGFTDSFGAGGRDLLLSKFDASGNHLWSKTLGGTSDELGFSVIQTSDGGLAVTGHTNSFGAGYYDLLLSKFDASGNHLWSKTLGGTSDELGFSVIQTSDGGLVVTGRTESFGAGGVDFLLSKFDASGNHLWSNTVGGTGHESGYSVIQTSDGGLVVTGYTYNSSFGAGGVDFLLSKFDASGSHLWSRTLGGTSDDWGSSAVQTTDGGLVVTGHTNSFGAGYYDLLLSKLDASGNTCLGATIIPTVTNPSPTVTSPSPTVNPVYPTINIIGPMVISVSPETSTVCEVSPRIISINDVSNDQGRQVRVKWNRCYFDAVGSPVTITEYSLWRRIGEDKGSNLNEELLPSKFGDRIYPPGEWDFIKTVPARGEEEYNTVCPTLGDSTQAGGMYWSVFFVSAITSNPIVYFDSDPDSGYSLDNIPPLPIRDLEVNPSSWFTLEWTVPGEYPEEHPISTYDIRYNTAPVGADTQAWWNSATACAGTGFFNYSVGQTDSIQVAKESWNHPHVYFAIKGLDERPNASQISNFFHFICGDINSDEVVDVGDVVYLLNYLFKGGHAPQPLAKGDCTCDGVIDVGDIVYLINYLFKGGPPPCGS